MERSYRKRVKAKGLVSFQIAMKETDLWVSAERRLEAETRDLVLNKRQQLETYIHTHPDFLTPMASVAGAIAQHVASGLLQWTEQVIVENGGDIFLKVNRPVTVSLLAGHSPLSGRIGIKIPTQQMPLGICSSSGTVGHSLSMGKADVVCILSSSAIMADGAATALGNRVKSRTDLKQIATWADQIKDIRGGLAIIGDKMATWGAIELVDLH
jgi:ApbE superfamily uncharacterized protein (UPF0280 family)